MNTEPASPHPRLSARAIVLLYACFAALWILLSDRAVEWLLQDPVLILLASTAKGWVFVAVTSLLLYLLMRRLGQMPAPPLPGPGERQRPLAFMALLAAAIVVLVAFAAWHSFSEEKARATAQLQAISQAKAREIGTWHQERLNDARWAQKSPYVRELWLRWRQTGARDAALRLRQFMNGFFVNDAVFTRMEIVDSEGHRALGNAVEAPLPASPAQTPFADPTLHHGALVALTHNEVQRVGPWRDADGTLRLAFLAPLAADSAWPAVLVLHVDPPEFLHPALRDWPLPQQSAESVLFRQDGSELLLLSALRHEDGAAVKKRLPLDNASRYLSTQALLGHVAPGELIVGIDYRDIPSYGVVQRIVGTDWWLLAKQDRAELLHNALIKSLWIVLAGALALLAVGGALYLHGERLRLLRSTQDLDELRRIEHTLKESEAQYRLLAENSSDVVWLYDLVAHRFRYASPSVERLLGYHPAEVQRMSMADVLPPEQVEELRVTLPQRVAAFTQHGDEAARTVSKETVNIHRDGHHVPVEVVSTLLPDAQGKVTQVLGVTRDITARKKAEARLIQLSQAVEQSPASVIITDLESRIVYVNPAFEQISGYTRAEVLGQTPRLLRTDETPPEVHASMWFTLSQGLAWNGEMTNRHKSGRAYVQNMNVAPVRDAQGRITHYLAVQLDVTAQKHAEDKAFQLAWYNALTGLANRHKLLAELQEVLRSHQRGEGLCALLLLNVDRFQPVNDALGHAAGDLLLKQIAARLNELHRSDELLAHLSADEFAVLLYTDTADTEGASAQALRVAQALHERLDAVFTLPPHEPLNISVCIGITLLPHAGGDTPGDILRRADTALHRAKQAGTRQTAFFDTSMEQLVSKRFALEQDLRRGLVADELRLYLQPQVNAQGHVVSAEALVRWQHPVHGLLAPGAFISIAEESELITELGRWVLKTACRHLGELRRDGLHLPISVNVSPRQFHQPGFVHVVQDMLLANGAAAEDLVIEITEGIVMDQLENVVQKMAYLASLGIQFSLDDFGTGYSSLAYLKRLPIHEIKIDRSFVQDAPNDPSDGALVEAMLSVARHLRLKVVAEGVETVEQAEFLNARGTVIHQGYLFGRPEPAADMLARWRASQLGR